MKKQTAFEILISNNYSIKNSIEYVKSATNTRLLFINDFQRCEWIIRVFVMTLVNLIALTIILFILFGFGWLSQYVEQLGSFTSLIVSSSIPGNINMGSLKGNCPTSPTQSCVPDASVKQPKSLS
jgi:hypothetical protein